MGGCKAVGLPCAGQIYHNHHHHDRRHHPLFCSGRPDFRYHMSAAFLQGSKSLDILFNYLTAGIARKELNYVAKRIYGLQRNI